MNGEIPNVPIITLAGVASLTDMLPELPLPTPLPVTMHNKSLLFHPKIADDARKILGTQDESLITQLVQSLRQTSTDHIELKDTLAGASIEGEIPELLSGILRRDPNVFKGNRGCEAMPSPRGVTAGQSSVHQQQMSPFHASPYSPYQQNNTSPRCAPQTSPGWHQSKQNSPYAQHGSPNYQNNASATSSNNRYQQPFPNFSASSSNPPNTAAAPQPAVNGEHIPVPAVPAPKESSSKTSISKLHCQPVVVLSPVQAKTAEQASGSKTNRSPSGSAAHKSSAAPSTSNSLSPAPHKRKSSLTQPVVVLKPLDAQTIHNLTSPKQRSKKDRLRDERRGEYRASLTERVKRRRRPVSYSEKSPEESKDSSPESEPDSRPETPVEVLAARKRKKDKKNKRHQHQTLSMEELLESATFKKFSTAIENVFDSVEEVDISSFDMNDEELVTPAEILIAKVTMVDICGEAAKLKSQAVLNQIPAERLVKLLTILQWNVKDGARLLPNMNNDDDEESELWREITMDRVMRSVEAGLTAIYIMIAPDMPKQVFLEDVMERTIMLAKFQLHNTVYPEFDPVYRIDPSARDYSGNFKLKRARAGQVKNKLMLLLYNKMTEIIGCFAELIEIQELTDTVILQLSSLGVSTFFVENISELQLNAMKLVTCIFSKYDKHRQLILEDIFASLARLPSSKRNLRNYRLNADESIQMVTALALQLIQCVVKLPTITEEETNRPSTPEVSKQVKYAADKLILKKTDNDVVIVTSYETSMRTGYNFLSVFLKKCTHKGEDDYRPLFENFVQDLLSTVNKPEWPASELLLSLLGRILVKQFSNKSVDMSLRTASLEYLGIVAARLRKDAVSSQLDQEMIDEIVEKINEDDNESDGEKKSKPDLTDQTQSLQHSMLEYLAYNGHSEPAYLFARQFYIAQWYRDSTVEAEKRIKSQSDAQANEAEFDATEAERTTEVLQNSERRKGFLATQMTTTYKPFSTFKPSPSKLDYDDACLVARYLSLQRPFAQSFDIYLTQILRVLSETAVAVRTKAMKCLSAVVEADPGILGRDDMQRGVDGRFLDQSTSVREAAVELVGKFILIRPELIPSYYEMLSKRILDTGISVRKRVIKIFREICLDQPDFGKIPEMCVKMIRRVNDEEGIKKLVNEVFHTMWFTPIRGRNKDESGLLQKVVNITEVVAACKDTGLDYFEQLLDNLLKGHEDSKDAKDGKEGKDTTISKHALQACKQIVDCLVENVLRIEERTVELTEGRGTSSQRLVACLSTLHLFSKIKPELMVDHATTLQPYLDIKCSTPGDHQVLHCVAQILELVVPLMDHPSESFLATLEEDMMKLILKHGMTVLQSCVSCLGAVVNCVSHNYKLVKDCFQKFFGVLSKLLADHKANPDNPALATWKPTLLRSLFTVGLLCKHFDLDSTVVGETKVCVRVFEVLTYFLSHEDEAVKHKAVMALGFLCIRHYEFMLGKTLKTLYDDLLMNEDSPIRLKIQVLKNLQAYLVEEEVRMAKADAEWRKIAKSEDLKEMGDVQSGMASTIMQIYLKQTLESFFHSDAQVRLAALNVINLILRQGLVHPVQCVPYLVSMGTDSEASIRVKADQQLQEIEKKYPGFIHMKALAGIKMSFRLQRLLQPDLDKPIRGVRVEDTSYSLNAYLYTVLRTSRAQRRGFLQTLLNLFDDSAKVSLKELIYIGDNLAFFPYLTQDEPLFIIHQIEVIVSVSGSNLLQAFKEILHPNLKENGNGDVSLSESKQNSVDEYDDEDEEKITEALPEDIKPLEEILKIAQGCVLLLLLKQHLKELYGFTDSKIHRYSPSEGSKANEKPLSRKVNIKFEPEPVLDLLKEKPSETTEEEDKETTRTKLVQEYLDFKQLMLSIDPPDDDDDDEDGRLSPTPKKSTGDTGDPQQVNGEETPEKPGPDGESTVINATPTASVSRTPKHHHFKKRPRSMHSSSSRSSLSSSSHKKKLKKRRRRHSGSDDDDSDGYEETVFKQPVKKRAKKRRRRISDSDEDSDDDDPDFVI